MEAGAEFGQRAAIGDQIHRLSLYTQSAAHKTVT